MRVTVIVPLYNKATHIGRCLRSIAGQTLRDFEAIVVDDGSTDGSGEIARAFGDPRFRVIAQANAGPGAARNRGASEARGEFLAFLDGDDEWLPDYLEDNVRALEAAGESVGALAVDEGPHHAPEKVALEAKKSGSGYTLNGAKTFVIEGMAASVFVVSARTSGKPGDKDGITLFLVPADAKGVTRKQLKMADSRGYAAVTFAGVEVGADAVLGTVDKGGELLEKVLDRARAGLAAEMLGSALQAFDVTLDYLKTRVQFGQVIGSFQALQHRAAKMFTELELARSCVEAALTAIDNDSPDVAELVSLAKAKVGDTLHLVSNEMVQMHGGIGMTDAHDAGFYLKRARAAEAAYGNQAYHRDRYARINGY